MCRPHTLLQILGPSGTREPPSHLIQERTLTHSHLHRGGTVVTRPRLPFYTPFPNETATRTPLWSSPHPPSPTRTRPGRLLLYPNGLLTQMVSTTYSRVHWETFSVPCGPQDGTPNPHPVLRWTLVSLVLFIRVDTSTTVDRVTDRTPSSRKFVTELSTGPFSVPHPLRSFIAKTRRPPETKQDTVLTVSTRDLLTPSPSTRGRAYLRCTDPCGSPVPSSGLRTSGTRL